MNDLRTIQSLVSLYAVKVLSKDTLKEHLARFEVIQCGVHYDEFEKKRQLPGALSRWPFGGFCSSHQSCPVYIDLQIYLQETLEVVSFHLECNTRP